MSFTDEELDAMEAAAEARENDDDSPVASALQSDDSQVVAVDSDEANSDLIADNDGDFDDFLTQVIQQIKDDPSEFGADDRSEEDFNLADFGLEQERTSTEIDDGALDQLLDDIVQEDGTAVDEQPENIDIAAAPAPEPVSVPQETETQVVLDEPTRNPLDDDQTFHI